MLLSIFDTQPTDLLHDTAFQFVVLVCVTLLSGFAGAFVAYWVFRKQRRWKEISYEVISDAPIASVNWQVADRIDILFRGIRVRDANLLVLAIWNSGNEAVRPEDYIDPITFYFGERMVLDAEVLNMEPEDLINPKNIKTFITLERVETEPRDEIERLPMPIPKLKGLSLVKTFLKDKIKISHQKLEFPEPNSIRLAKFLFHSKESISLKVVLVGSRSKVYGSARITDGKITEFDPSKQPATIVLREITLLTFGEIMGFFLYILIFPSSLYYAIIITIVLIICSWLIFLLYSLFQKRYQIKKNGMRFKWSISLIEPVSQNVFRDIKGEG